MNSFNLFEKHRYARIAYNPLYNVGHILGCNLPVEFYDYGEESILDGTNFVGIRQFGPIKPNRTNYINILLNKIDDNETKDFLCKLINDNTGILNWAYLDNSYSKFNLDKVLHILYHKKVIRRTNRSNIILLTHLLSNDDYYIENIAEHSRLYKSTVIYRNNIEHRQRKRFDDAIKSLKHDYIVELFDNIDYEKYYYRHNLIYKEFIHYGKQFYYNGGTYYS